MRLPGLDAFESAQLIPHRPVLIAQAGSHSHGTYCPPEDPGHIDDIDIVVVYIPDLDHYFGLGAGKPWTGKHTQIKEWDCAAYEIRHFASLLAKANPNVVSSLWLKPEMYLHLEREGKELVAHRKLFSSKLAAVSFGAYARAQLQRMTAYHDTGENACCPGEKFHTPECQLTKERGRGSQKKFATGYMGAKRKGLVEKYGYDCKNAAHLIRLLRMGIHFLKTGEMVVDRRDAGDAQQLIDIKHGGWPLERVRSMTTGLFAELDGASKDSPLPDQPDMVKISRLLLEILCISKDAEVVCTSVNVKAGRPAIGPIWKGALG